MKDVLLAVWDRIVALVGGNKTDAIAVAVCAGVALLIDPALAIALGVGYVAYRVGALKKLVDKVKGKINPGA